MTSNTICCARKYITQDTLVEMHLLNLKKRVILRTDSIAAAQAQVYSAQL